MKKSMVYGLLMTMLLTGCASEDVTTSGQENVEEVNLVEESATSEVETDSKPDETIEMAVEETTEISPEMEAIYTQAIKDLMEKNISPDGSAYECYAPEILDRNHYAVADIDGDGRDEFLINITEECSAGMCLYIYEYDENAGKFIWTGAFYPSDCKIYDNGVVTSAVSHSGGISDDANWPYDIYQYNKETDEYDFVSRIEPWVDEFSHYRPGNADPKEFPTDIDADGCGIVYGIQIGEYGEEVFYSRSYYEEYINEIVGDAKEIDIDWISFKTVE